MKLFNKNLIIIIRHGERADMIENVNLDNLKCGKYDSELTQRGKSQAYEAGEEIKEFLESNEINLKKLEQEKKIKLLSSPFARTLMTSHHLLKGLELSTPITIEKGLCEHFNAKWYPIHPENFLVYEKQENSPEKNFLYSEINYNSIICESKASLPKRPETHEECANRLKSVYNDITKFYFQECGYKIMFLVTHFLPIEVFFKLYSNV